MKRFILIAMILGAFCMCCGFSRDESLSKDVMEEIITDVIDEDLEFIENFIGLEPDQYIDKNLIHYYGYKNLDIYMGYDMEYKDIIYTPYIFQDMKHMNEADFRIAIQGMLAHELTHYKQDLTNNLEGYGLDSDPNNKYEQEAYQNEANYMAQFYGVYVVTEPVNGVKYVGYTKGCTWKGLCDVY